jgi:hypothetical protein
MCAFNGAAAIPRTAMDRQAGITVVLGLALAACGPVTAPLGYEYQTEEIEAAAAPPYSAEKLYRYTFSTVNPDSVLRVLLNDRLPVDEAWLPIEDLCAAAGDPIGPRFTVILEAPTSRMSEYDFEAGNGIRECTTRIRRFIIFRFK